MSNVINYYENYDEDARFSRNSRKIEFLTTTTILDGLIDSGSKILDVGAGPGAYSFYYAERGHEVTAVDLTPRHIEIIKSKAESRGISNLQAFVANAADLSRFPSESYDVVLCFGPLYHITEAKARESCINECLRVLKKGGILAIAYINKYDIMPMLVTRDNRFIKEDMIDKLLVDGTFREGEETCFWTDSFFTSPDEIENFMSKYHVKKVDHAAADGLSHLIGDQVDLLDEEQFDVWFRYHLKTCRVNSILGASCHGLYVCEKI